MVHCVLYYYNSFCLPITALHGMQTRSSDENSVCLFVPPSICLSFKRLDCDKTEERYVQILANVSSWSVCPWVGPSVCASVRLSVCRLQRSFAILRLLKFSAMFLRHVVPWPSMTFV